MANAMGGSNMPRLLTSPPVLIIGGVVVLGGLYLLIKGRQAAPPPANPAPADQGLSAHQQGELDTLQQDLGALTTELSASPGNNNAPPGNNWTVGPGKIPPPVTLPNGITVFGMSGRTGAVESPQPHGPVPAGPDDAHPRHPVDPPFWWKKLWQPARSSTPAPPPIQLTPTNQVH